jgi:hypothetical protein
MANAPATVRRFGLRRSQALCFTMLHHLVADTMADILAFMQVRVAPALDAAAAAADDVDEMMDAQADDDAAAMGVSAYAN